MKGEYVEEENDNNTTNNNSNPHNMFAKFSHPHQQHQPQPPKFQPPPHHLQQHFPPPHLHHPFSEEADSATPPPPSHHQFPTKKPKTTPPSQTTSNEDLGGTIEVSRRPRGRPPGSKNKPKPPIVITREPEPAMAPYILELPSGADIVDSLTRFTRRRSVGICVLTASGAVANITLKQPSTTTPGGTVTFHGRFDILSLSAVVLVNPTPFNGGFGGGGGGGGGGGFTISLAGPHGQIVGGKVVGSLICSGTVYVIAASFNNPTYCRLPLDDQDNNSNQLTQQQHHHHHNQSHNNNDSNNDNDQGNSPVSGGGGGDGSGAMSLYSGHMGTTSVSGGGNEVIWANATPSSARPPY